MVEELDFSGVVEFGAEAEFVFWLECQFEEFGGLFFGLDEDGVVVGIFCRGYFPLIYYE